MGTRTAKERQSFTRSNTWLRRARKKFKYLVWRKMRMAWTDEEREKLLYGAVARMVYHGLYAKGASNYPWAMCLRMLTFFAQQEGQVSQLGFPKLEAMGWFWHRNPRRWSSRKFEKKLAAA